jgi:phosphoglycolate phosphatase
LKLILFDIDGTLIRTAGAGRISMEYSFQKIYGIRNGFRDIQMMGRTDPSILREALANHDLEWDEVKAEAFKDVYFRILREEIEVPRPGKRLCPGILELLTELKKHPDFAQGLLTGNWRESAYIKLRHFRIDTYFPFGAFADDSPVREELVPFAVKRFQEFYQAIIKKKDVYIIGDTPADIQCARPYGATTIAVATGFHTYEQLGREKPDYLFADLGNWKEVLKIV